MKVNHIGIVVKDLNKSIDIYKKLGYIEKSSPIIDNDQNIIINFLENQDDHQVIELITALNDKAVVGNYEGYHHICYEVLNECSFIENFKQEKIGKIFTPLSKAIAFDGKKFIFACLQNGCLTEFLFL